jgi:hypothetical protein
MTTRATWAGSVLGGVTDAAYTAMSAAVAAAQAKADAAMTRANSASTAASSAASTASSAASTAGTAAASLDQLNQAIATGNQTHAGFQTAIDALQSRVQLIGLGYAQLTSILALGGSTDITLALSRDMGRTDYNVEPSSFPAATLTVKSKTRTSVVLTVKTAALALAVGTPLIAVAWI